MKCIIPGTNIKVFGRAIHSLSKIGEELYMEPLEHGLALRTVNSSRSAYACFLFAPSFFQHYDDGSGEITSQDTDDDTLRCKIAIKSIMTVFRSLSTMEKTVERCKIRLNMKDSRLVFTLHCRHGIVKTHNLAFIECETLQAVFSKDMCPNSLTASSKLLCDAVLNFQNNQEEVTLIVSPEKIILKNYVEDEPDPHKVMHTNLTLDPDEFDNCQIGVDTEVTFCLKELRAILAFSEVTTLPLTLHFESAGRPIVFCIDSDSTFEGNFVLATLADQQSQSQAPTQARHSTQKRPMTKATSRPTPHTNRPSVSNTNKHRSHYTESHVTSVNKDTRPKADLERSQRLEAAYDELMDDDNDFDEMLIENNTTVHANNPTRTNINDTETQNVNSRTDSVNKLNTNERGDNLYKNGDNSNKSVRHEKGDNLYKRNAMSPIAGTSKEDSESPVIPVLGTKVKIQDTTITEDMDEDEDAVPGTPPAKRFRSLFFGSQASTQQSQRPDLSRSRVLAPDTDEEEG